jgi:recombination associated protein RdgC
MIKNATIYTFTGPLPTFDELAQLAERPPRIPGPVEPLARGWGEVIPDKQVLEVSTQLAVVKMTTWEHMLPPAVLNQEVDERRRKLEKELGRPLGRKEVTALKDEAMLDMRRQAFKRAKHALAYIDYRRRLLVVDTASGAQADELAGLLRDTLGGLSVRALCGDLGADLAQEMRRWLDFDACPFIPEYEAVFTAGEKARIAVKGVPMWSKELEELTGSDTIEQMRFEQQDNLEFTLTLDARLLRLAPTDVLVDARSDIEADDAAERLEADILLMADAIGKVVDALPREDGPAE